MLVDRELLSRRLSLLRSYVAELTRADDITWAKYRSDLRTKAFVERYLHLAVEELLDIANHLISFERWREPTGYRDIFLVLRENDVITNEHLPVLQDMASLRNLLVHRYENVDDEIVFGIFKKRLNDFDLFIELVSEWAGKQQSA